MTHSCADLTAVLLACGFRGGSADAQRSVLCLDTFLNSSFTALISLNVPNLKQGLVSCLSALHVPPRSLVYLSSHSYSLEILTLGSNFPGVFIYICTDGFCVPFLCK